MAPSDLAAFQEYRHDPRAGRFQGWTPQTDAEALEFLHRMAEAPVFPRDAWIQVGIAERHSNRLIGDIGIYIDDVREHAEMGFTLNPRLHHQGLASEALGGAIHLVFNNTPVLRIECVTDQRNKAAIRLLEKIGMRRVAAENAVFRDEACVEYRYRLLRTDQISTTRDAPAQKM
jgi:RimJ/RimL family protein N-acetyltransferase